MGCSDGGGGCGGGNCSSLGPPKAGQACRSCGNGLIEAVEGTFFLAWKYTKGLVCSSCGHDHLVREA
eukprot:g12548.t1